MAKDNNQVIKQSPEDQIIIRRYLLGALSESEQQQIEERILIDDNYFLNLQLIEEDLIDEYVQGTLSLDEREKFHHHFLSTPERIRDVKFARALGKYVKDQHETDLPIKSSEILQPPVSTKSFLPFLPLRNPALRWSLLAALLLIIFGSSWMLIKFLQKPNQSEPLHARETPSPEQQSPPNEQSATNPESNIIPPMPFPDQRDKTVQQEPNIVQANKSINQSRPTTPATPRSKAFSYSTFLSPGMVRGDDGITPVEVPKEASRVDFNLILQTSSYSMYQASLVKGEREIRSWNRAKAISNTSGNYVTLTVPVEYLSNGSYYILLNGVIPNGDFQEINRYYFRISRK